VPLKKKRVCIGIAKFYVKIAHVFAAIVMTINPVYVYKDENGNTIKRSLSEKNMIPENTPKSIAAGIIYFLSQEFNLNIAF
jgi:hypothetical protein